METRPYGKCCVSDECFELAHIREEDGKCCVSDECFELAHIWEEDGKCCVSDECFELAHIWEEECSASKTAIIMHVLDASSINYHALHGLQPYCPVHE